MKFLDNSAPTHPEIFPDRQKGMDRWHGLFKSFPDPTSIISRPFDSILETFSNQKVNG